jgi:hypothetical protein
MGHADKGYRTHFIVACSKKFTCAAASFISNHTRSDKLFPIRLEILRNRQRCRKYHRRLDGIGVRRDYRVFCGEPTDRMHHATIM